MKNERRLKLSHPDGQELFDLATRIAQGKNPQIFFDGQKEIDDGTTGTPEYKANQILLRDEMQGKLEGGIWRDTIEELPVKKRKSPKK